MRPQYSIREPLDIDAGGNVRLPKDNEHEQSSQEHERHRLVSEYNQLRSDSEASLKKVQKMLEEEVSKHSKARKAKAALPWITRPTDRLSGVNQPLKHQDMSHQIALKFKETMEQFRARVSHVCTADNEDNMTDLEHCICRVYGKEYTMQEAIEHCWSIRPTMEKTTQHLDAPEVSAEQNAIDAFKRIDENSDVYRWFTAWTVMSKGLQMTDPTLKIEDQLEALIKDEDQIQKLFEQECLAGKDNVIDDCKSFAKKQTHAVLKYVISKLLSSEHEYVKCDSADPDIPIRERCHVEHFNTLSANDNMMLNIPVCASKIQRAYEQGRTYIKCDKTSPDFMACVEQKWSSDQLDSWVQAMDDAPRTFNLTLCQTCPMRMVEPLPRFYRIPSSLEKSTRLTIDIIGTAAETAVNTPIPLLSILAVILLFVFGRRLAARSARRQTLRHLVDVAPMERSSEVKRLASIEGIQTSLDEDGVENGERYFDAVDLVGEKVAGLGI